jgi:hypothetical protein
MRESLRGNDLQLAICCVKQAEVLIDRQRRLITKLSGNGLPTDSALHLLYVLQESLKRMEKRVDVLSVGEPGGMAYS